MWHQFASAAAVALVLVLLSAAIFYEILAHIWVNLPRLEGKPRLQIVATILATFAGHTIAVWLFGSVYFVLDRCFHFGTLAGNISHDFMEYIYFSAVSYSSLGLGDVYPTEGLQLLVGVEAIIGLMLIGWSVTFTYLVTEKYLFHRRRPGD